MEVTYGIGVKNRYALFMDEEQVDPLDFVAKPCKGDNRSSTVNAITTHHSTVNSESTLNSSSNKGKSSSKRTGSTGANLSEQENKAASKDFNGSQYNVISKNKTNQGSSQKFSNTSSTGKQTGKDSGSHSSNLNASNKKGEKQERNRSKQERSSKPFNNSGNASTLDSNQSRDNTWNPVFGTADSLHQDNVEDKKNRKNREDRTERGTFSSDYNRGDDSTRRGGRGRGGARGTFRGRGRGGFDNRGKREYDRHSGSDKAGIKPVEKRDGSGSFNWGNINDQIDAEVNTNLEETQDNADRSGDENPLESTENKDVQVSQWGADDKPKEDVEEAPKEMTLEEYKRLEKEKRVMPKFNLRKSGEGEDNAQWKATYVLKKKIDDDDDEYEEVEVEEEIRHGRQKRVLDIEINFKDENRELRRGGRGRGGARGGRGPGRGRDREARGEGERGLSRRGEKEQSAPKVDDYNDFPSL